jgi:hypothetical protein
MFSSHSPRFFMAWLVCAGLVLTAELIRPAHGQTQNSNSGAANLVVEVKDSETGEPISQARLTLQFQEPGDINRFKLPKKLAYSAKTNAQGRYKFTNITKGTIHVFVTADRHQSFGKEYELTENNQVVEVRLKKPQPLL